MPKILTIRLDERDYDCLVAEYQRTGIPPATLVRSYVRVAIAATLLPEKPDEGKG